MTEPKPKPISQDELDRARAFLCGTDPWAEPPWDGRGGLECFMVGLLETVDYWKARSPVRSEDVAALGIDYVKAMAAWREHNSSHPSDSHDDPEEWDYHMDGDDRIAWMCNMTDDPWAALASYAEDCTR